MVCRALEALGICYVIEQVTLVQVAWPFRTEGLEALPQAFTGFWEPDVAEHLRCVVVQLARGPNWGLAGWASVPNWALTPAQTQPRQQQQCMR